MKTDFEPINRVNMKLLQTFILVAEHKSFRQAATGTHRSQSAVSSQIKSLEEQLGVALFHRTTRSVRLTAEGEELLASAIRAMQEMDLCLRKLREAVDMRRGRISLSCSPTIAATRLPRILSEFEHDYPGIQIFVREVTSEDLFTSIRKQEVDFGIGPVTADPEFKFEPILNDDLYALVPQRLLPTAESVVTLEDLTRLPVLLLNPATALRALLEETVKARGLKLTTKYQFTQAQTLISMASAGLGAAILPKTVMPEPDETNCQVLKIVEPSLSRQVAIITLRGQALSPAAFRLAELVKQLIDTSTRHIGRAGKKAQKKKGR